MRPLSSKPGKHWQLPFLNCEFCGQQFGNLPTGRSPEHTRSGSSVGGRGFGGGEAGGGASGPGADVLKPPLPSQTLPFHLVFAGQAHAPAAVSTMPAPHVATGVVAGVTTGGASVVPGVVLMPPLPSHALPFHFVFGGQAHAPASVRTMPPWHSARAVGETGMLAQAVPRPGRTPFRMAQFLTSEAVPSDPGTG